MERHGDSRREFTTMLDMERHGDSRREFTTALDTERYGDSRREFTTARPFHSMRLFYFTKSTSPASRSSHHDASIPFYHVDITNFTSLAL
jgi:hypothetical protein